MALRLIFFDIISLKSSILHLQSHVANATCRVQLELIHDQLPLAVPCYDLVLVIELTVGRHKDELRALPTPLT